MFLGIFFCKNVYRAWVLADFHYFIVKNSFVKLLEIKVVL